MRNGVTFIVSLVLIAACGSKEEPKAKESAYKPAYKPGTDTKIEPGAVFVDVTAAAGIDFVHVNGSVGKKYLPETMGSGVALFDYDGDGDLDMLFVQSGRWEGDEQPTMRLYRNDGAFKFTDVTKGSGLDVPCYGMGAAVADYDADGDLDVYLTCLGRNMLFRNEGGRFERVKDGPDGGAWVEVVVAKDGKKVTRTHPSWTTGAAWLDADGDGDLDLIMVSYVRWTQDTDVYSSVVAGQKAFTRPQLYTGDTPRLYLQEDGKFIDATAGSGLNRTRVLGKSMAICIDDFDGDGKMDVFVANDTVQNFLFLNKGGGKFVERAINAAVAYDDQGRARAAMGVDTVDYRNDGRLTIVIGNFSEEPVSLFTVVEREGEGVLFQDDASTARVGLPTLLPLTFGLLMTDIDLDGWCDMVLANGHIEPSITQLKKELQYEQSPQYFRNLNGKRFRDVSLDAGRVFAQRIVGRGLAAGDLDGDGDIDLVFTSNGGRPIVMRCDLTPGNRALRLRLRQPGTKNLDALGAVVRVTVGGVTQRRVVRTGGSYLSQSELTLTLGLGNAARADSVVVIWPDGTRQEAGAMDAGTHLLQREP